MEDSILKYTIKNILNTHIYILVLYYSASYPSFYLTEDTGSFILQSNILVDPPSQTLVPAYDGKLGGLVMNRVSILTLLISRVGT